MGSDVLFVSESWGSHGSDEWVGGTRPPLPLLFKSVFRLPQPNSTRHLLVTWEKIGFNFFGVCRVIFDDNIKNGGFQEVGTSPPIEKALVN